MDKVIEVKVQTGARQEGIEYLSDGMLKARIKAIPQKGEANARLIELLAGEFKISKKSIKIIKGKRSKIKLISIRDR
ncbi:MAG: DUF167 domain-containing protein [Nitrospirota bacterium]